MSKNGSISFFSFFTRDALRGHTVSKNGSISFLRGMPLGGIPCLKTGRLLFFLFTRDALRGHTVSKNGSISFFFFLRGMP